MSEENLISTIISLNNKFWESTQVEDLIPFHIHSSGWEHSITFIGQTVYYTEDDQRPQDDETGDYLQSIEEYCIQEAKKVLNSLLPILNWS